MAFRKNLVMKKVSIIVPVYNAENTIERCVRSLKNQKYANLEIILIDDGSTDNSLSICERCKVEDDRIRFVHQSNHGVSYTRNYGIDMATGKYLMFVDSDDQIKDDCIQTYVSEIESAGADVVIGGITMIASDGNQFDKLPERSGIFGREIWNLISCDSSGIFGYASNKLYDLDHIKERKIYFNTELYAQEDLDFALSVFDNSTRFCLIPYSGYLYYYTGGRKKHPYHHYIMNKIKIYECGKRANVLDIVAKRSIAEDIEDLLYVAMYYYSGGNFSKYCEDLRNIQGITNVLKEKDKLAVTTRLLFSKRERQLRLYLAVRKQISHMIHRK